MKYNKTKSLSGVVAGCFLWEVVCIDCGKEKRPTMSAYESISLMLGFGSLIALIVLGIVGLIINGSKK
ncbi:MAG: putative holin-like toxin [Eubacteriales bacterium]|nr:putative holin-like toxin [Eubacteriales bacterium]